MTVFSLRAFQTPAPLKGIKWKFEQMTVSLFSAIQMSAELHPQQSQCLSQPKNKKWHKSLPPFSSSPSVLPDNFFLMTEQWIDRLNRWMDRGEERFECLKVINCVNEIDVQGWCMVRIAMTLRAIVLLSQRNRGVVKEAAHSYCRGSVSVCAHTSGTERRRTPHAH